MNLIDFDNSIYEYYTYTNCQEYNVKGAFIITEDDFIFRANVIYDTNTHTDIVKLLEAKLVSNSDYEQLDKYRKESIYGYTEKGLLHLSLPIEKDLNEYQANTAIDICKQVYDYNKTHKYQVKVAMTSSSKYMDFKPIDIDGMQDFIESKKTQKVKKIS